jgi:hypothetical protein
MEQYKQRKFTQPTLSDLEEFRRFLGPLASRFSRAQLPQLYAEMHQMASLLLDIYLERRKHTPLNADEWFESGEGSTERL